MNQSNFRYATEEDIKLVLDFIIELAKYEGMEDQVVVTEKALRRWLFEEKKAEVIFALEDNKEVGFVLFYYIFSTFSGKAGLFLEDLFVKSDYRKKGYGMALIKQLAKVAALRGCQKLDWMCLDWNKSSINFYLSLGAECMKEWSKYQIADEAFIKLISL